MLAPVAPALSSLVPPPPPPLPALLIAPPGLSTFLISSWMDLLQATDVWLALFVSDPYAASDPRTVEVASPAYSRPAVVWNRPGPRLLRVTNACSWTGLVQGTRPAAIGGFDAATNGHLLFASTEDDPVTVGVGGVFTLPANSYYLGLDATTSTSF